MGAATQHGTDGFIAALQTLGANPVLRHGVIAFAVAPNAGAYAGTIVTSGVDAGETTAWPLTPPHWVHFPDDVAFARTNARASAHPDWTAHSRDIPAWAAETNHALAWLSHVRTVLADAVR